MGRQTKTGIDYFSHDTDLFHDKKIRFIKAKHGMIGYAVFIRLLEEIYRDKGYYIEINEDYNILFADENNIDLNVYIEILNDYIKKELFDSKLYEKYNILTSKRIQSNYIEATLRRKNVEFVQEYLLLEIEDVNNKNEYVNILPLNVNNNTQSKVKKSKVNNINTIPFAEIIEYLNLKIKGTYKHTTKKTRALITTRWNEGFELEDFYKAIDNTYTFRMSQGGDLTYVRPMTIFDGKFEERVNGTAFGFVKALKEEKDNTLNINDY